MVPKSFVPKPNTPQLTGNENLSVTMGNGNGHKIEGKINEFFIFATYSVEYYYDNEGNPRTKETITDPVKVGTVISNYPDEVIPGYRFNRTENFPLTISAVAASNVIKVYYVKGTFDYEVRYYKDSISTANFLNKIEGTGTYLDPIPANLTLYAPAGYATPGTRSGATIITENEANNVVNVVYAKRTDLGYTVNYYKDSISTANFLNKIEGTGTYLDPIPANLTLYATEGYITPGTRNGATIITEDEANNVVNVVYSRIPYRIEFLLGNTNMGDKLAGETLFNPVYAGDTMPTPPHPYAKFGYKFLGWKGSDGSYIAAPDYKDPTTLKNYPETVSGSVTYTADWSLVNPKQTFPDKIPSETHFDQWWVGYGILCVSSSTTKDGNYEVYFADWFFNVYDSCTIAFGANEKKFDYKIVFTKDDITLWNVNSGKEITNKGELTLSSLKCIRDGMHATKEKNHNYGLDFGMGGTLQGVCFVNPFGSGAKLAWLC